MAQSSDIESQEQDENTLEKSLLRLKKCKIDKLNIKINAKSFNPRGAGNAKLGSRLFSAILAQFNRFILDTWGWELLGLALSISCQISIGIILYHYDGRLNPSWLHGLTLNSIVSTLVAIAKTSLLSAMASAMGQCKWLWLRKQKKQCLHDFEKLDSASRGPWGCFMLLVDLKIRHFALLGALVTILSLALDPFIQQLLAFPVRFTYKSSKDTGIPVPHTFHDMPDFYDDPNLPSLDLQNTVMCSLFGWGKEISYSLPCPSGDCTWEPFTSLELCSQCLDVTPTVRANTNCERIPAWSNHTTVYPTAGLGAGAVESDTDTDTCKTRFPSAPGVEFRGMSSGAAYYYKNGSELPSPKEPIRPIFTAAYLNIDDLPHTESLGVLNDLPKDVRPFTFLHLPGTFANMSNPLVAVGMIDNIMRPKSQEFRALECSIDFCLKRKVPHVSNGTDKTSSSVMRSAKRKYTASGWGSTWSEELEVNETSPNPQYKTLDQQGYKIEVNDSDAMAIAVVIASAFSGEVDTKSVGNREPLISGSDSTTPLLLLQHAKDCPGLFKSMANVLTHYVRQKTSNPITYGKMAVAESYVLVRWRWLLFPLMLVVLSACFLVLTLLETRRQKTVLWKMSSLAPLYHDLDRVPADAPERISDMEKHAASTRVRLGWIGERGWQLLSIGR
ncbi:MAG: hypothetical protein Q9227_006036 [Pyrenula ochraceoflavens]